MFVYVISKIGKPLMPCKPVVARLLLKDGKARVNSRTPFTIQLTVDSAEYVQPVTAGMDTGCKTVGCAAIANDRVVYQSEISLRQNVSKKMDQRRMYRRTRRGRKLRYRPARWLNRASMCLTPSLQSKLDSHLREKKQVETILPVTEWKVETATFDIHKITNPAVEGKDYQNGKQKGFYNVKAYALHRDGYKCRSGRRKVKHSDKLQVHHIQFRSNGGGNAPDNLITLCEDCHVALHAEEFELKAKSSRTRHGTEVGILKSRLKAVWAFNETLGYETKWKREQVLNLPKTHANDAVAICCEDGEWVKPLSYVFYKRHVSAGDYQQTKGPRSNIRIPTGKLHGLRKFDLIETPKGIGFVKGKRSSGFFAICDIANNTLAASVNVKKTCKRLSARTTTLTTRSVPPPP